MTTRGAFRKKRGAKNPIRGLAVSRLNPEHERHVGVYRDHRPAWSLRSGPQWGPFKDPNPAHPGFFR